MGFDPSGFTGKGLDQDFARPPLTRFFDPVTNHRADWRPRVSISLRSAPSSCRACARRSDGTTLLGFRTGLIPKHLSDIPSGL
jgi:hypothetical protein